MPMPPLILSSDSHVFEPPDLWQTRIDAAFRDRAPRIERIDGGDHVVVEADQILSGIGLISIVGAGFEAPETICFAIIGKDYRIPIRMFGARLLCLRTRKRYDFLTCASASLLPC